MSVPTLPSLPSLPTTYAWIGSAAVPACVPAQAVTTFEDSDDFLLADAPYDFDFYLLPLQQRGVAGLDLIRLIRRRSAAGIVAFSERLQDEFVSSLLAGADMVLPRDAGADQVQAAITAVQRRSLTAPAQAATDGAAWTLIVNSAVLRAPDGTEIALSDSDLAVMQCFAQSQDGRIERQQLVERLWGAQAGAMDNALHATLYRLRKRIEQSGQKTMPLRALAKVGYEFRARLRLVEGSPPAAAAAGVGRARARSAAPAASAEAGRPPRAR